MPHRKLEVTPGVFTSIYRTMKSHDWTFAAIDAVLLVKTKDTFKLCCGFPRMIEGIGEEFSFNKHDFFPVTYDTSHRSLGPHMTLVMSLHSLKAGEDPQDLAATAVMDSGKIFDQVCRAIDLDRGYLTMEPNGRRSQRFYDESYIMNLKDALEHPMPFALPPVPEPKKPMVISVSSLPKANHPHVATRVDGMRIPVSQRLRRFSTATH